MVSDRRSEFERRGIKQRIFAIRRVFPWLIWLLCGGLATIAYLASSSRSTDFPGIISARQHVIASLHDGNIDRLPVAVGDLVNAGDVVVQLNTTEINAKIALAYKELKVLQSKIGKASVDSIRDSNKLSSRRRRNSKAYAYELMDASEIENLEARIQLERSSIGILEMRRDAMQIVAPFAGRISETFASEKQVIRTGQPILNLVNPGQIFIDAYVDEKTAAGLGIGDNVQITTPAGKTSGQIMSILPLTAPLPKQITPPRLSLYTRKIVIGGFATKNLLIGSTVRLTFSQTNAGDDDQAQEITLEQPSTYPEPTNMVIPHSLSKLTPLEPSGIVWNERLNNYLIVSDDVGSSKNRNRYAPWIFAMSPTGAFRAKPLVIEGLKSIDDVESITMQDNSHAFVLSSQSKRKKNNKRPRNRQLLVKAQVSEGGLKMVSSIPLYGEISKRFVTAKGFKKLGVKSLNSLDIEGMSYYEGDLLLAVKSPRGSRGSVLFWKISAIDSLFDTQKLSRGQLRLWRRIKLPEADANLSDLLVVDQNNFFFTTVSERGHSRVWQVAGKKIRLVAKFDNARAEGVALTPNKDKLLIVFDQQREGPKWAMVDF